MSKAAQAHISLPRDPRTALADCIKRTNTLGLELRRAEDLCKELDRLRKINPDTELPIRRVFESDFDALMGERRHNGDQELTIGIIRLDEAYSKIKNTREWREWKKALLFRTVERISTVVGKKYLYQSDRLDEFILIFPDQHSSTVASKLAERICTGVEQRHEGPAEYISFGCRIGLAVCPIHGDSREALLDNADIALVAAEMSSQRVVMYSTDIGDRFREKRVIERELRAALRDDMGQFRLVFQPFVDKDFRLRGSEVLVRWTHPRLGTVLPTAFIPIAEETGDIINLGQWVLYRACRQLKQWYTLGYDEQQVSVNLSPYQFRQPDLEMRIKGVLDSLKLDGSSLKLEITEGAVMEDPNGSIKKLGDLRKMGIRISIDDFGMGYSSLSYLMRYPIDILKIDKSFVDGITTNENSRGIVRAIISMADALGLETLAEGVETQEQLDYLLEHGCMYIQGYFFSRPVAPMEYETYLKKGVLLNRK